MTGRDRRLYQLWQQFDDAREKRAYGLAIQSLAQLDDEAMPPDLRQAWTRKVADVPIHDDMQAGIRDWARDYIERVNLILSTGGQLDSYDALYVSTASKSLQSVRKVLQQKGLAELIDLGSIDPSAFRYVRT